MELLRQGTSIKPCGSVPAFMELWLAGDFGLMISWIFCVSMVPGWLHLFPLSCSSFLYTQVSYLYNFPFFWRIPFNVSCKVGLLVTYCLNFCLSEKDFTFEGSFYWTQNSKLLDFSINTLHISLHSFLDSMTFEEKYNSCCVSLQLGWFLVLFCFHLKLLSRVSLSVWFSEVWIWYERV